MKPINSIQSLHAIAIAVFLVAAVCGLPVLAQQAPAETPVNLRPQWEQGQSVRYEFWSQTEKVENATIAGQSQNETTTYLTEGVTAWKVEAINADGSATCTMKLEKIKFTITAGEADPFVVDSENLDAEQGVFGDFVAAMVSLPLEVMVNADGSIDAVVGLDKLRQLAGQEAVDLGMIPEELDFIESASELATLIAAPAQATPGQTWNTTNRWNHDSVLPGTDTVGKWDTTFTFDSITEIAGVSIAMIKSESDIDMQVDLSKLPEESPDIDVQVGDATAKGEILFDLSRNETVARNDSMAFTAIITVTPPVEQIPPIRIKVTETSQSQLLRITEEAE